MPKEPNTKMKNRVKWVKENWDFKYIEPSAARIALEKKKQEEYQKKLEEEQKKKDMLYDSYFNYDGTCISHDRYKCGECRIPATGRCYSSLEEY